MKAEGFRYSPGRDSVISPIMSSDDEDFGDDDDDEGPAFAK